MTKVFKPKKEWSIGDYYLRLKNIDQDIKARNTCIHKIDGMTRALKDRRDVHRRRLSSLGKYRKLILQKIQEKRAIISKPAKIESQCLEVLIES